MKIQRELLDIEFVVESLIKLFVIYCKKEGGSKKNSALGGVVAPARPPGSAVGWRQLGQLHLEP